MNDQYETVQSYRPSPQKESPERTPRQLERADKEVSDHATNLNTLHHATVIRESNPFETLGSSGPLE